MLVITLYDRCISSRERCNIRICISTDVSFVNEISLVVDIRDIHYIAVTRNDFYLSLFESLTTRLVDDEFFSKISHKLLFQVEI